jgi:hypothetical protein
MVRRPLEHIGVIGLIMDGIRPARVADSVIEDIRSRERGGLVELPKRDAFKVREQADRGSAGNLYSYHGGDQRNCCGDGGDERAFHGSTDVKEGGGGMSDQGENKRVLGQAKLCGEDSLNDLDKWRLRGARDEEARAERRRAE